MRFDSARPAVKPDTRTPANRVRLAPRGHKRPRIRRRPPTSCAHGPQTIAGQAGGEYVSHPGATDDRRLRVDLVRLAPNATNDREPGVSRVRLAPTVHQRPRARCQPRTFRAHGPQTSTGQAQTRYGLRPRATNDREPSATHVHLAPTGHERSATLTRSSFRPQNRPD